MRTHHFPVYRKLANERSFFRVESELRFTEVQRIGQRCQVHVMEARTYPDRLRIAELLEPGTAHVLPSDAEEFDRWYARAGD